jgi:hypothetical protein
MASSIGELQQRGHHAGVVFGDLMVFVQVRKEGGREGGRGRREGRGEISHGSTALCLEHSSHPSLPPSLTHRKSIPAALAAARTTSTTSSRGREEGGREG